MKLLFFYIFISSTLSIYSTKASAILKEADFISAYNKINLSIKDKVIICNKQNDDLTIKAYIKKENGNENDSIIFVEDEQKALSYINAFDVSKFTESDESAFYSLIKDNCDQSNFKNFIEMITKLERERFSCVHTFENYFFIKGLIYAVKNYRWSKETKNKAIKKIFDYIHYQTGSGGTLMGSSMAAELLSIMDDLSLIDKKSSKQIKTCWKNADARIEKTRKMQLQIRKERKKDNKDGSGSCRDFTLRDFEIKMNNQTKSELKDILNNNLL
ncbi:MAG: hypothetical protein HQK49_21140 [Oligoflexia bacterium]|nr:hypothetical protein [Oligoflexia bacterium]